jgi:hypothetical protein
MFAALAILDLGRRSGFPNSKLSLDMPPIYLDYIASTPIDPAVRARTACNCLLECP